MAACDVNGDGNLDLVTAHYSGHWEDRGQDAIAVLLGDGRGGFRPAPGSPFRVGAAPVAIVCADLDGDGFDDVATANQGSNSVTILPGGRLHMGPPRDIPVGRHPASIAAGNLLGHRWKDLVVTETEDDRVSVISLR